MNVFETWEAFEDILKVIRTMSTSISLLLCTDDPSKLREGLSLMQDSINAARTEAEIVCRILRDEAIELFKTGAVSITQEGGNKNE